MKTKTFLTAVILAGLTLGVTACATTPSSDTTAKSSNTQDTPAKAKPKKVKGGSY